MTEQEIKKLKVENKVLKETVDDILGFTKILMERIRSSKDDSASQEVMKNVINALDNDTAYFRDHVWKVIYTNIQKELENEEQ